MGAVTEALALRQYILKLEAELESLRARMAEAEKVVEIARAFCKEERWIANLPDTHPHKGNGNRLVDALAHFDAQKSALTPTGKE